MVILMSTAGVKADVTKFLDPFVPESSVEGNKIGMIYAK